MTRQLTEHAHAAKLIRAELKKHGLKGSVRSKSYAGGNSINVELNGDYLPATVDAVKSYCDQFEMGHFDGMTDMYEYSNARDDIPQVKFVFVSINYSDDIKQAAWDWAREHWAECQDGPADFREAGQFHAGNYWGNDVIHQLLSGGFGREGFWSDRKERRRAA